MQRSRAPHGLSRRRFLILSTVGLGLGAGLLSACGAQPAAPAAKPTEAPKPAATTAPAVAATSAPAAPQPTPKPVITAAAAAPTGAAPTPAAAATNKPVKKGGILKMGINQESA